jgi:hypothetical protein
VESNERESIPAGADVVDADGERVGSVVAATDTYIVVERGLFFPSDFYIPHSAITDLLDGVVHLTVTKAEASAKGWEEDPNGIEPENEPAASSGPATAAV